MADWWSANQPPDVSTQPMAQSGDLGAGAAGVAAATGGTPAPGQTIGNYGNLSDPSAWMGLVGDDAKLTQWVQSQNPGLAPDLVQYYVGKIKGQPGANPTEQAGSANYWGGKLKSDPTTGGGSAAPGGFASIPGMDPGASFRFSQGVKALQGSAASHGTLLTGGTLKALADFGQQDSSQEYSNAFGRQLSLAQLGENAAAGLGNTGSSYATNASNTMTGAANAQGAAGIAGANAWTGALGNTGSLASLAALSKSGFGNQASA